ncbi:Ornithine decarboxylase antizyme family and Acyl-CoA N-acyltransferase domain-containing protein [Strongyloides ratti]|uniref:Ornithine decarboxylase antizyme n=1 Tax=Strongyloides ratti TaxID=34506 RepID=A0A090LKG4_STRRB|nr:Ornithine decarboxylase antizyme family and Acyl-CoA N-acyltransferase domain-containing protein [Strongyloides ratti]CEF68050.1 Ornithine decarboxylase antizyme family and Acyl-CoA N-acyltransferase domain-containing protein [Strongyloides ratti]
MDNKLIFSEPKQDFGSTVGEVNQNFTNLGENDVHKELVKRAGELVKGVDKEWNGSYLEDENSYAVYMSNHDVLLTVSRARFIEFFEHCDEVLKVRCIYMCFDKQKIFKEKFGIPYALRSIGFKMLNPDNYPASIDKSSYVVMRYRLYI